MVYPIPLSAYERSQWSYLPVASMGDMSASLIVERIDAPQAKTTFPAKVNSEARGGARHGSRPGEKVNVHSVSYVDGRAGVVRTHSLGAYQSAVDFLGRNVDIYA